MNRNQSQNLTQKQKDLVKRLDKIRSNKESVREDAGPSKEARSSMHSQKRNEQAQQNRRASRKVAKKEREDKANPNKFARPVKEKRKKVEAKEEYESTFYSSVGRTKSLSKDKNKRKPNKKKSKNFINQLSDGDSLSQAIILSEVLSKPLALRKKK